ncbi:hypothetical protein LSAT2_016537 [Lamellibrachia satsuma]|nr:hypothetical protein LSAT2_016537 [Lamellibrachia satsuma]
MRIVLSTPVIMLFMGMLTMTTFMPGVRAAPMSDGDYKCNDQCDGGTLCIHGLCQCPKGYSWTSHQTKCAKDGVVTDLPEGATCDEVNETSYCGFGFKCLQHGEHPAASKCVKYYDDSVDGGGGGGGVGGGNGDNGSRLS